MGRLLAKTAWPYVFEGTMHVDQPLAGTAWSHSVLAENVVRSRYEERHSTKAASDVEVEVAQGLSVEVAQGLSLSVQDMGTCERTLARMLAGPCL